jgi:hypothetical protein
MRLSQIARWTIRQNFRYSWGQGKIPNPLEIAVVTLIGVEKGIPTAILSYGFIFIVAWVLGYIGEIKGWIRYEQRYVSELNPVLMEIVENNKTNKQAQKQAQKQT